MMLITCEDDDSLHRTGISSIGDRRIEGPDRPPAFGRPKCYGTKAKFRHEKPVLPRGLPKCGTYLMSLQVSNLQRTVHYRIMMHEQASWRPTPFVERARTFMVSLFLTP
jgi:hypothetical protein